MKNLKILEGKRLLIVDDEEDVLETLKDCFDRRFGRNWMEKHKDKDKFGWLVDLHD